MHAYRAGTFETGIQRRVPSDDPYFRTISSGWGEALKAAIDKLPDFSF
jgi:putative proteasome-type protease